MFSNSFKKKIIKKYNISESIINRPIHYRIPDLVNMKLNDYPIYIPSKRIHNNSKDLENYKTNSISPLSSRKGNIMKTSLKKHAFKHQIKSLLNEEYPINIYFNKNRNKKIKSINNLKKFRNLSKKAVINNIINIKNHKQSVIFPNLFQNIKNSQKLTKINHMMPPNFFFIPQTKIKLKNQYRNQDNQLKESETNIYNNMEKNINKKEKSLDYDKYSIKIIKTYNNNGLINSNNTTNNDDIYSYDDSPIHIRSRYFNSNIINDENNNYN